jgi:hypothetical protein
MMCLCMFSGNFLRAAQRVYMFAWPGAIFLRVGRDTQHTNATYVCCVRMLFVHMLSDEMHTGNTRQL